MVDPPASYEECAVSWVRCDPSLGSPLCWCSSSVPPVYSHLMPPRLSHSREGWVDLMVGVIGHHGFA